jgi:integrase
MSNENTRRRPSEFTVYKQEGLWYGKLRVGTKRNGEPIYKTISEKTQDKVIQKLKIEREKYLGFEMTDESLMTLEQWLAIWMEEYKKPTLRMTTYDRYQHTIKMYINPKLGAKVISDITERDVQSLYNYLQTRVTSKGELLSPASILAVHRILKQALQYAKNYRYILQNPTRNAILPPERKYQYTVMNDEQLQRFMSAIRDYEDWYEFFYTEITTGLRRGEICGLRLEDYDATRRRLRVNRQLYYRKTNDYDLVPLKTEAGVREIVLPVSTAKLLNEIKRRNESPWMFHKKNDPSHPIPPSAAYDQLKKILRENNIPLMRFHDLRHTFATHAIESGVDPKTLSRILGHSRPSFTLDRYTHVTINMLIKAADIVKEIFDDIRWEEL